MEACRMAVWNGPFGLPYSLHGHHVPTHVHVHRKLFGIERLHLRHRYDVTFILPCGKKTQRTKCSDGAAAVV